MYCNGTLALCSSSHPLNQGSCLGIISTCIFICRQHFFTFEPSHRAALDTSNSARSRIYTTDSTRSPACR